MQDLQLSEDLNEDDPKYLCCCECCHATTGVKLLLALYIFGNILQIFLAGSKAQAFIALGLLMIVAPCTIYALNNEKHVYLWAFIIAKILSVVERCMLLLLISYPFFSNNSAATSSPAIALLLAVYEDKMAKGKKAILAIIVMLVLLAYNSLVLRVLFGCKRYIADKSKAEMMNSRDAAPRPNAVLPKYGQVQPPPYEHNFYYCLVQNAGYQQQSASSELQQQPTPRHYGVGWGYQQITSAPQQSPSSPSNALDAKIRPLSRGMAASPYRLGLGGQWRLVADHCAERTPQTRGGADGLAACHLPQHHSVDNYMNEYRNQLPNRSLKGLSVEGVLEEVVSLILNKQVQLVPF